VKQAASFCALLCVCLWFCLASPSGLAQPESNEAASDSDQAAESDEPSTAARAEEVEDLPLIGDLLDDLPTVEELLEAPPVDWIVLSTRKDRTLIVQPVTPRPRTLETMRERIVEYNRTRRQPKPGEVEQQRQELKELHYLIVFLADDPAELEYRLHIENVREIIHHEDQMLLRVDALLAEGNFGDAQRLLFVLNDSYPDWPGLSDRHDRLLFREAETKTRAGDLQAALVLLAELHRRNPKFTGLSAQLGATCQQLMSTAIAVGDYLQARHFLNRLQALDSSHPLVGQASQELLATANALLGRAQTARQGGDHRAAAVLVEQAAQVWPAAPGLQELHQACLNRFPRLHVGVLRTGADLGAYPLPVPATARIERLTESRLFEVDEVGGVARYRSRFCESWEPTDLGRRAVFHLRQHRAPWESLPVLRSADVVLSLADRIDPSSPAFDDRLAARIKTLKIRSPFEFEIGFAQVPLRTEAMLELAIRGRPSAGTSGVSASTEPTEVYAGRFVPLDVDALQASYQRGRTEPDDVAQFHVAEVTERAYATDEKALQGLLRGEVSMLASVPPRQIAALEADGRFFVQRTALSVTHVLQFHPRSKALHSQELRRALYYGIDRRGLLAEFVLRGAPQQYGRLTTAPYCSRLNGYDPLLELREADATLAYQLTQAAKARAKGQLPKLRMICEPNPLLEAAAAQMIEQWGRLGLRVALLDPQAPPENWDIVYRTVQMSEPARELWPFLTLEDRARVEPLIDFPDWLRQKLIELDAASDAATAAGLLKTLQRHLYTQVEVIPLWEIDDFVVLRKNIGGFRVNPVSPYQGIESWTVAPWYPMEAP
jgi:tetratricopeptide (TPR) repeat protein